MTDLKKLAEDLYFEIAEHYERKNEEVYEPSAGHFQDGIDQLYHALERVQKETVEARIESDFVKIILPGFYCVLVDKKDAEEVLKTPWRATKTANQRYYVKGRVYDEDGSSKDVFLHRFLLKDNLSEALTVDHKNRNSLDNRRENLRVATRSQNNCNRPRKNSTGFRGVRVDKGSYVAAVNVDDKTVWSGRFKTAKEAARAYDQAALTHHGEFALLNYPRDNIRLAPEDEWKPIANTQFYDPDAASKKPFIFKAEYERLKKIESSLAPTSQLLEPTTTSSSPCAEPAQKKARGETP